MTAGPDTGYSGTPLVRKLGIAPGARVALLRAPDGFADVLGPLPDGVRVRRRAQGPLDVIVAFCVARAELERSLPAWRRRTRGRAARPFGRRTAGRRAGPGRGSCGSSTRARPTPRARSVTGSPRRTASARAPRRRGRGS